MIRSHKYLAQAKVEELAERFAGLGYTVVQEPAGEDRLFDLLATKGDQTIAFEVKASGSLHNAVATTRAARELAHRKGYDFRLVVVAPPHTPAIDIEGLTEQLDSYLTENTPSELLDLALVVRIDSVCDLEFDAVAILATGIEVEGSGTVELSLEHDGGKERDGVTFSEAFPFKFAVWLNHDLSLKSVQCFTFDLSSFYD